LTESGDYTAKYDKAVEMMSAVDPLNGKVLVPERPAEKRPAVYNEAILNEYLDYNSIVNQVVINFNV